MGVRLGTPIVKIYAKNVLRSLRSRSETRGGAARMLANFKYRSATSDGHAVIERGTVDAARRRAVPENEPPDSYGFRANVK
ncbi:hypothetical protein GCM10009000_103190 [Halobacterium noricense]